jgi:hypothetical protein
MQSLVGPCAGLLRVLHHLGRQLPLCLTYAMQAWATYVGRVSCCLHLTVPTLLMQAACALTLSPLTLHLLPPGPAVLAATPPHAPTTPQVLRVRSLPLIAPFLDPAQDVLLSLEHTRLRLLALSCMVPGASTLLGNLLRTTGHAPKYTG